MNLKELIEKKALQPGMEINPYAVLQDDIDMSVVLTYNKRVDKDFGYGIKEKIVLEVPNNIAIVEHVRPKHFFGPTPFKRKNDIFWKYIYPSDDKLLLLGMPTEEILWLDHAADDILDEVMYNLYSNKELNIVGRNLKREDVLYMQRNGLRYILDDFNSSCWLSTPIQVPCWPSNLCCFDDDKSIKKRDFAGEYLTSGIGWGDHLCPVISVPISAQVEESYEDNGYKLVYK